MNHPDYDNYKLASPEYDLCEKCGTEMSDEDWVSDEPVCLDCCILKADDIYERMKEEG